MSEPLDRRAVILDKAAELFAAKGVSATTVREIADSVGILSGSLYHHFKSKDDMAQTIVIEFLADLTARYEQIRATRSDPRTQISALVHGSLDTIENHPFATEIYQSNGSYLQSLSGYPQIRAGANTIQKTWLGVIEAGVESGEFRSDIPARVIYRLVRDSLWLSVRWFHASPQYTRARFGDDLTSTFLDGITRKD